MEKQKSDSLNEVAKEAIWVEKQSRISTVWIVPIVALVIGAWLVYQTLNEKGPTIKIVFKSAEGVEAGKTLIKYKDIEVGKVTDVTFGEALETVVVEAELKRNMVPYLSEKTRFWVMKARLSANEVQGLDTLLSGVYIVMDPEKGAERVKEFKGLDKIPVVSRDERGTTYLLKAEDIGSIDVGSPIYYKKLQAGSVASYRLQPDGKSVLIEVFIHTPYNKLVTDRTRFWNASGISANIGTDGVEIRTESLTSIISGGLAFDNLDQLAKGEPVEINHQFVLYRTLKEAKKIHYKRELYFWVYFQDTIRGLKIGSPVEFRGVTIGEVVSYSLVGDAETANFEIPILIKIEPERFSVVGKKDQNGSTGVNSAIINKLIQKGFRAQLQSGNLLTGELFIDLDFHEDMPPTELKQEKGYYVLPTVPATMESLKSDIKTVLDRLSAIPFEEIGKELQMTVKDLRTETMPRINSTIDSTNSLMKRADQTIDSARKNYLDSNAQINKKLIRLLDEMTRTSRSIKNLTDYLERHPESLIKGK